MEDLKFKILIAFVSYNPSINTLESKIISLKKIDSHILIYDNDSNNKVELQKFNSESVSVIFNNKNIGLPRNYNRAIEYGIQNHFDHLLILDQDSNFDENFLHEYEKYASYNYLALVPLLNHSNEKYNSTYPELHKGEGEIVRESINSGLLLKLKTLPPNLRFDDDYFIDCVDFDFFEKIKKFDLKILRVNTAILNISLGNICKVGPFFLYNYSSSRLKIQARDRIVFLRKHPISKKAIWLFLFATFNNMKLLLLERNRLQKFFAMLQGTWEGFTYRIKNV